MYEQDLKGKVAFVTGASGGIGRAIALRLAQEGCSIVVMDLNVAGAEETLKSARSHEVEGLAVEGDVSRSEQVQRCVEAANEHFSRIDILVNNAGILRIAPVLEMEAEDWKRTFEVNVDGVFNCCRAVAPQMVARGKGRIINIASWFGKRGQPYNASYCASKFAVIGFTQTLALELARHFVTVNAICPGTVTATDMRTEADATLQRYGLPTSKERESGIPLGRLALPDDMARMAAFLASDESAYMTGQAINVTGGLWLQ